MSWKSILQGIMGGKPQEHQTNLAELVIEAVVTKSIERYTQYDPMD